MTSPFDQSAYQVRVEWGVEGLARLAPADVIVVVDVLRFSSSLVDAVPDRPVSLAEAQAWSLNGAAVAAAASAEADVTVLVGSLRNASAVAEAILQLQEQRQRRTFVSVIAAGERTAEGTLRFAVEDQLGVGAIVAALVDRGIDHTAPEAAVAAEAFRGLRRGVRHLLSGSGSGRELAERDPASAPLAAAGITPVTAREAAVIDDSAVVPVLRGGAFEVL